MFSPISQRPLWSHVPSRSPSPPLAPPPSGRESAGDASSVNSEPRSIGDQHAWTLPCCDSGQSTFAAMVVGVRAELANVCAARPQTRDVLGEGDVGASLRLWNQLAGDLAQTVEPGKEGPQGQPVTAGPSNAPAAQAYSREQVTLIQYCIERWATHALQSLLRSDNPLQVTAVIHTPTPCTPLRVAPGRPVPSTMVSPLVDNVARAEESIARRVVSVRALAHSGATVCVCYPAGARDSLATDERDALMQAVTARNGRGSILDCPTSASKDAYAALSGATYLVGSRASPYDVCVSFRLVQASQVEASHAASRITVDLAMQDSPLYAQRIDELRKQLQFDVGTVH